MSERLLSGGKATCFRDFLGMEGLKWEQILWKIRKKNDPVWVLSLDIEQT